MKIFPSSTTEIRTLGDDNGTTITDNNDVKSELSYRRVQVLVVHRHGDRSPITSLKDEAYWETQLIPESTLDDISKNIILIESGEENTHKANGRGPFGKLTMLGLQQMIDLGTHLREQFCGDKDAYYIDEKGRKIFPYIWNDDDTPLNVTSIRVISTMFDRAIKSAKGVLKGLFPEGVPEPLFIDTLQTNTLLPDPQPRETKEQEDLEDTLAIQPHIIQREEELLPLAIRVTEALHPLLASDAREACFGAKQVQQQHLESIEIEPLAWNQLGEILKCLSCRNMLPDGITEDDHINVVQHAAWRWFQIFRNPRLAYLSMNTQCKNMIESFQQYSNKSKELPQSPPMTIYSAHDSTLIVLLCAFKLEQPVEWPEYGSYLLMELLEEQSNNNNELYVRFSLNGNVLKTKWEEDSSSSEMISLQTLIDCFNKEDERTKKKC